LKTEIRKRNIKEKRKKNQTYIVWPSFTSQPNKPTPAQFLLHGAEYEAFLFGMELLNCMGVKHVKEFDDSRLVVQQVLEEYQCFDGTLNSYLEKCWGIIHSFDEFSIRHISRVENHRANNLAQDASGYRIKRGKFCNTKNLITGTGSIPQVADCPSKGSGPSGVTRKVLLIDSASKEADTSDWRTP
jgi:hypothetical protein